MPKLLTNGHKTAKEEMREMLNEVKPKALRERLLKVLGEVVRPALGPGWRFVVGVWYWRA